MKCIVCRNGETFPGKVTVTLERAAATLVVREVPAAVCDNCGEEYVDANETARLLKTLDDMESSGIRLELRHYVAA